MRIVFTRSIKIAPVLPLLALAPMANGQDWDRDIKPDGKLTMESTIRGRYLDGLGFVLIGNPRGVNELFQPVDLKKASPQGLSGTPKERLYNSGTVGWEPRLTFPNSENATKSDRFVLLARLQDSIDSSGKDAGPAFWNFVSDNAAGTESMDYSGALVFDLYTPGIDGMGGLFGYDQSQYGFHFKFGADFDRSSADGKDSVDRQEYFMGVNFLAPKISSEDGKLKPSDGSQMDVSFRYQRDDVTGKDSTSVVVGWKPLLRRLLGRQIPYDTLKGKSVSEAVSYLMEDPIKNKALEAGAPEGSSQVEPATKTNLEKLRDTASDIESPKRDYFSIQPNFDVEQVLKHATGLEDGICGVGGVEVSASLWDQRIIMKYQLNAAYNFEASDSFCFQEASVSVKPWADGPLSVTASYQKGERAPTYRDEDVFRLGIGAKF